MRPHVALAVVPMARARCRRTGSRGGRRGVARVDLLSAATPAAAAGPHQRRTAGQRARQATTPEERISGIRVPAACRRSRCSPTAIRSPGSIPSQLRSLARVVATVSQSAFRELEGEASTRIEGELQRQPALHSSTQTRPHHEHTRSPRTNTPATSSQWPRWQRREQCREGEGAARSSTLNCAVVPRRPLVRSCLTLWTLSFSRSLLAR